MAADTKRHRIYDQLNRDDPEAPRGLREAERR
jgi:hypothetical protein